MFAIRQMIDDPQDFIPVPAELRHRPTEVIFIALDSAPTVATGTRGGPDEPLTRAAAAITAFRGKGKGGAVARLLQDRQSDREQEA
ncbi:MAG: hypothetical protein MZU95_13670 [Desulfomicrobium escambiense]|nr:hypothetical protein [Desulfomicrobium escambiense]